VTISELDKHLQEWLRECRYLKNLSDRTLESYEHCWRMIRPFLEAADGDWGRAMMDFAATGRRNPGGVNIVVRSMKPFVRWLHTNGLVDKPIVLRKQKEPVLLTRTLTEQEVAHLVGYKPGSRRSRRAHTAAMVVLDCGLRSAECLNLRLEDVNLDDQLIEVMGKGSRQRVVPFSHELRRRLFLWVRGLSPDAVYLFPTRRGRPVSYRNATRDLESVGEELGLKLHWHLFRHTFGTLFIRNGGEVTRLQRILGHRSITTTLRYVHLQPGDLKLDHEAHSALAVAAGGTQRTAGSSPSRGKLNRPQTPKSVLASRS
jgi:site-specific recombinase XerD